VVVLRMTSFLLNIAPNRITLDDLNLQLVDGRNENGYGRQCGVPVAVIGRSCIKRRSISLSLAVAFRELIARRE
jgi:hypothetical protein